MAVYKVVLKRVIEVHFEIDDEGQGPKALRQRINDNIDDMLHEGNVMVDDPKIQSMKRKEA